MNRKKGQCLISRTFAFLEDLITYIAVIFLILMIIIVTMTVITRYTINFTFRWSDEVALLLMIWFGFIGLALGVKSSIHLSVEFFMGLLPDRFQKWIYQLENILVGVFGWSMLYYGIELYNKTKRTILPATMWSRGLLYVIIPVSGAFVFIFSIEKFINNIKKKALITDISGDNGEEI
ncbi:MAG TPA: TRAP transporter small permease [Halanaerobiales bacterium]|nr:TRAP transporter small permease [Halanaerobiales bacterium]